jgi:hypothetical protein
MRKSTPPIRTAAAALALFLAGCAGRAPGSASGAAARVLQLSEDVRASVREHHGVVLVDLQSRSGIGAAAIEFMRPAPAARFVLHTRGLEQFRLAYGDVVVELAVGQDGSLRQTGVQGRGARRALGPRDPLWLPVRVVRADRGGIHGGGALETVEVETPSDFETAAPERCSVRWIDFFR